MVKELREKTGAGMMDCKRALMETGGDIEKATDELRKKGLADAAKKAGRAAAEGTVTSYIHAGGKIGVMVEVNCETDFVAMNPDFQAFAKDVAMHIAAASPLCIRRDEIPAAVLEREKEVYWGQAREMNKPEAVLQRVVDGRVEKFLAENCLLEQKFVKDPDRTIQEVLNALIVKIKENISIRRFVRFQLGEGLAKKVDNFAEEVAAQAGIKQA
jgi:elongation factor Ts